MAGKYTELKSPAVNRVSVFTPHILCFRPSSARATQIGRRDDTPSSAAAAVAAFPPLPESGSSGEYFADPGSPKIGCMGQIKNRKVGPAEENAGAKGKNKFRKLKKMLSGKSSNFRRDTEEGTRKHLERSYSTVVRVIRFENRHRPPPAPAPRAPPQSLELDPPLPVTRHPVKKDAGDGVNLWKRRCGAQLEGLKLQQQRLVCTTTTNSVSNIPASV